MMGSLSHTGHRQKPHPLCLLASLQLLSPTISNPGSGHRFPSREGPDQSLTGFSYLPPIPPYFPLLHHKHNPPPETSSFIQHQHAPVMSSCSSPSYCTHLFRCQLWNSAFLFWRLWDVRNSNTLSNTKPLVQMNGCVSHLEAASS